MMREQRIGNDHVQMKKKTLKTAASITIATWCDEIHELRRKLKHGQKESIIMGMADPEELRKADEQFKRKINAAHGLSLRMDRQGVGGRAVDTSTEEPPD